MAIYLPDQNALFIEVPKTGTSWVRAVLAKSNVRHQVAKPPVDITERHGRPGDFIGLADFRFCTVRHPLSWALSWYKFQTMHGWPRYEPGLWHPQREIEDCRARDISTFLELLVSRHPGYVSRMLTGYATGCDIIMRQERLSVDLAYIARRLRITLNLAVQPVNVSQATPIALSRLTLRRFLDAESAGIERWYPGANQ